MAKRGRTAISATGPVDLDSTTIFFLRYNLVTLKTHHRANLFERLNVGKVSIMKISTIGLLLTCTLAVTACSSSNNDREDSMATTVLPENGAGAPTGATSVLSPGGIWRGTDASGNDISLFVTESGHFHYVDAGLNQGSSVLTIDNTDNLESFFPLAAQLGKTFSDGTTSSWCTLSGSFAERKSIALTIGCRTAAGMRSETSATLLYSDLYERGASLEAIAGTYQNEKSVLTISNGGAVFSQDPTTGCVVNGQISIINEPFNLYDLQFAYSNCVESAVILNGSSFVGIALLDDTAARDTLFLAAMGDLDDDAQSFEGNFASFVEALDRL